jgi:hypothetical protein
MFARGHGSTNFTGVPHLRWSGKWRRVAFHQYDGSDWAPLDDYTTSPSVFGESGEADSLAIGAIAAWFGGLAGDEVFVGTGEFNPAYDAYFGVGIRHLASGTWTLEANNLARHSISSIVIDPDDPVPTHLFAATNGGVFRRPLAALTRIGPRSPARGSPTPMAASLTLSWPVPAHGSHSPYSAHSDCRIRERG